MPSRHYDIDDQYLDRFQHSRPSLTVWDRLQEPSVLISVLIIVFTVVYHTYGSPTAVLDIVNRIGDALWNFLVYITPLPVIRLIDSWVNSSQPMSNATTNPNATKSDMMRTALGLDRAEGMMASVFQARNRAFSLTGSALGLKAESDRPAGLGNHDNSCFQNSILQGLASLRTFPTYLSNCVQDVNIDDPQSRAVTRTLRALISDLNNASNNGRTLWTPNTLKFMSTWTQQDAQEYYSKILDDIDKGAVKTFKALCAQAGLEAEGSKDDAASSQYSDDSGYHSTPGSKSIGHSSFRNPLEGLLAQRVSCVQCGYSEGLSMSPFNCLTLSLSLDRRRHDLYERLDAYSEIEHISGVECPKCTLLKAQKLMSMLVSRMRQDGVADEKMAEPLRRLQATDNALADDIFDDKTINEDCKISSGSKVSVTKTKQVVIARPPQSLAIHINRSVFDPQTFDVVKNSAPVEFPRTLDLGPWCLGSAPTIDAADGPNAQPEEAYKDIQERWQRDPMASMIAGDINPSRQTGPIYELRAVVTHQGRHENGHYVCYRKHPDQADSPASDADSGYGEGQDEGEDAEIKDAEQTKHLRNDDWWRLSDHNVSRVGEDVIASLGPGVFMLFYECVDPTTILQDATQDYQDPEQVPAAEDQTVDAVETSALGPTEAPKIVEPAATIPVESLATKLEAAPLLTGEKQEAS